MTTPLFRKGAVLARMSCLQWIHPHCLFEGSVFFLVGACCQMVKPRFHMPPSMDRLDYAPCVTLTSSQGKGRGLSSSFCPPSSFLLPRGSLILGRDSLQRTFLQQSSKCTSFVASFLPFMHIPRLVVCSWHGPPRVLGNF